MAQDAEVVQMASQCLPQLLSVTLRILIAQLLLVVILGPVAFVALVLMLVSIPLQVGWWLTN